MNLREIDRLVAEHVMGWQNIERWRGQRPDVNEDGVEMWTDAPVPFYTHDIEDAWHVWAALRDGGDYCCMDIRWPICEPVEIVLRRVMHGEDHDKPFVLVTNDSAPLAICLAALKAKGVEVPNGQLD